MTDGAEAAAIVSQVRALGTRFDSEVLAATRSIYRPLVEDFRAPGVIREPDVPYGRHERHKMDVFLPASAPIGVLVFVHGGGFVGGDKDVDGVFYGNVGSYFARHGLLTLIPNYRLAPAAGWPAGAQDLALVFDWLRKSSRRYGVESCRTLVIGQSAGACHVASWLLDGAARGSGEVPVTAAMLLSGYYRVAAPISPAARAYFGDDESLFAMRSPINHLLKSRLPLWLGIAELDPGPIASQTYELADAVTRRDGVGPGFVWFRNHNHVSTVHSIGSPQDDVGEQLRRFVGAFL